MRASKQTDSTLRPAVNMLPEPESQRTSIEMSPICNAGQLASACYTSLGSQSTKGKPILRPNLLTTKNNVAACEKDSPSAGACHKGAPRAAASSWRTCLAAPPAALRRAHAAAMVDRQAGRQADKTNEWESRRHRHQHCAMPLSLKAFN